MCNTSVDPDCAAHIAPPLQKTVAETGAGDSSKCRWRDVINVEDLQRGINGGVVMEFVSDAPSYRMQGVNFLLRGKNGRLVRLIAYNCVPDSCFGSEVESTFPKGCLVTIREPYLRLYNSGEFGLRIDNPGNFTVVRPDRIPPIPEPGASEADIVSLAERPKNAGNKRFEVRDCLGAEDLYSAALDLLAGMPNTNSQATSLRGILLANRAQVRLQRRRFADALEDCDAALARDPDALKPAYRRGLALLGLRRFADAVHALELICSKKETESIAATATAALQRARTALAQSLGEWNFMTLPFDPEAQIAEPVGDYIGRVEIRETKDGRGWGLFVTHDVVEGELLFIENAISFGMADAKQITLATREHELTRGDCNSLVTDLIFRASTDTYLRTQLALLAWQTGSKAGRDPMASPPSMEAVRNRTLPTYNDPLSATRIAGVASVNACFCGVTTKIRPEVRKHIQTLVTSPSVFRPALEGIDERDAKSAVGQLVLSGEATPRLLKTLLSRMPSDAAQMHQLNVADNSGRTPLHYALVMGSRLWLVPFLRPVLCRPC